MLVVKVELWPGGDRSRAKLLTQATLDLIGQATEDRPELGVRKHERAYRVRLLKDTSFGGPGLDAEINPSRTDGRIVWRDGVVRGHVPGGRGPSARGVWDLVGGALKVLLGSRLDDYCNAAQDGWKPADKPETL